MSENLTTQKTNSKGKAIGSLILGVISVLPLITILSLFLLRLLAKDFYWETYNVLPTIIGTGAIMSSPLAFLISIVGLILGKLSLKSTKRNLGIIGIVFSLFGLGSSIFFLAELIK